MSAHHCAVIIRNGKITVASDRDDPLGRVDEAAIAPHESLHGRVVAAINNYCLDGGRATLIDEHEHPLDHGLIRTQVSAQLDVADPHTALSRAIRAGLTFTLNLSARQAFNPNRPYTLVYVDEMPKQVWLNFCTIDADGTPVEDSFYSIMAHSGEHTTSARIRSRKDPVSVIVDKLQRLIQARSQNTSGVAIGFSHMNSLAGDLMDPLRLVFRSTPHAVALLSHTSGVLAGGLLMAQEQA